jgi:hypothetical protein
MTVQQPVPEQAQDTAKYLDDLFTEIFGECVVKANEVHCNHDTPQECYEYNCHICNPSPME